MKYVMGIIATLFMAHQAFATQWLVIVDLPGRPQMKAWHQAGLPANELIGSTAIAVLDEKQVLAAQQLGFEIQKLELYDLLSTYLVTDPQYAKNSNLGRLLWGAGVIGIYRSAMRPEWIGHHGVHILNPTPLSERFWKRVMAKYIGPKSLPWDPFIQSLVDQVNADSIASYIQRLQDFKTRLSLTDSSFAASEWLRQKFISWGYAAEFDSFYINRNWPGSGYERNVIATVDGTFDPDKIFILCGHFDSFIWPDTATARFNAPGADDNASGSAAVLEAARIFKNHTWGKTIKFVNWSAEEFYGLGSSHFVNYADSNKLNIEGVVNLDMIGYMDDADVDCSIMLNVDDHNSKWLSDLFYQAGQTYAPSLILYQEIAPVEGVSDDYFFATHGYPAICGIERGYENNPNAHSTADLLNTLSPALYANVAKAALATLAILGLSPNAVKDVVIRDMGDGSQLVVSWSANAESDVAGYNVYWGRISENYTATNFVSGIVNVSDTLSGLMTDSTYYIVVRAVDADGYESLLATEIIGVPRILPLAPSNVTATPLSFGIKIDWKKNTELDLAGYRLYRKADVGGYDSLNTALLTDTSYTDQPLSGAARYYYRVRAFDLDGNAGPFSDSTYGRPATLDQGILVVDETQNWTSGSWPRDTTQDQFYDSILIGYPHQQYDFGSAALRPVLSDLVPYSTVLWHSDDPGQLLASNDSLELRKYLDFGGRLWLVGWKATSNLRGYIGYPGTFEAGDFIYDYLKVSAVNLSGTDDSLQGVVGTLGYPGLAVDPAKVPLPLWGGTLRYVESYTPSAEGEVIYNIDMSNNASSFEGLPCGIRYLGAGCKTVLFGFPLYFMDRDQARLAAQQVMADFGETSVTAPPSTPLGFRQLKLEQNTPNPFSRTTTIRYRLPQAGNVSLKVYNVAGQLVRTLCSGVQQEGLYTIAWDGRDDTRGQVSNGIYFYSLSTEKEGLTGKLIKLQ